MKRWSMRHLFYLIVCMESFQVSYFTPCFGWGIFSLSVRFTFPERNYETLQTIFTYPNLAIPSAIYVLLFQVRSYFGEALFKIDYPNLWIIHIVLYWCYSLCFCPNLFWNFYTYFCSFICRPFLGIPLFLEKEHSISRGLSFNF